MPRNGSMTEITSLFRRSHLRIIAGISKSERPESIGLRTNLSVHVKNPPMRQPAKKLPMNLPACLPTNGTAKNLPTSLRSANVPPAKNLPMRPPMRPPMFRLQRNRQWDCKEPVYLFAKEPANELANETAKEPANETAKSLRSANIPPSKSQISKYDFTKWYRWA
jgi:hypothetical protein